MKLMDYIINVFVMVDDFCKIHYPTRKLRQRSPKPKLTDSEAITMEIVGEYLGLDTDEGIYKYFSHHWKFLFPKMPDRSNFVRQCANLWEVKQRFFESLSHLQDRYIPIVDSMLIEVCKLVRARTSKQFKETATYSKWFGQTFFGYRLHLKINDVGMIRHFIVATARESDVRFAESLIGEDWGGWVLGDRGYRSKLLQQELWKRKRAYFHTSIRRNECKDSPLPIETIRSLTGKRRLVETVVGQLEQRFRIKTAFSRDL